MLRKVLILLPCFIYLCSSQAIIWETEYELDFRPYICHLVLVDSDGNIINIIDSGFNVIDGKEFSYFLKFNNNGEFLTHKELFSNSLVNNKAFRVPIAICQTGTEYQILGGISQSPFFISSGALPMIAIANQDGFTTMIHKPYDTDLASNYNSYGLKSYRAVKFNNTIAVDKKFFNGYSKEYVEIDEFMSRSNSHIIIACYDSLGKLLWRKGYDSLGVGGESYTLCDIKTTQFKTIMLLCFQHSLQYYDTRLKLLEIDYDGNVVNQFNITLNDNTFKPIEAIRFDDGNYCFLNYYYDSKTNYLNFIMITDSQGNIINKVDIPHKGLGTRLSKLKLSNDSGLICLGRIIAEGFSDDIVKLYMFKMNKELELRWEYKSSPEPSLDIDFNDLVFLKDNEFIVTGYKNRKNLYLAKFKDLDSTVNYIENEQDNQNFNISPNPVNDILSINSSIELNKIEIFSSLGLKVLETEWKKKIDVSGLTQGVYFLRAGYNIVKFIKL